MDIKLFDKRYVYLEWSDELEGKDCVLAKSYKDLKDFVNSGDEDRFCKANKGKEKPFTNLWSECDFCYYDPNLKVKKAWLEGKTIQQECGLSRWKDYINLPRTSSYFYNINWDAYEWRVKPTVTKEMMDDNIVFFKGTKDDYLASKIRPTRRMTNREITKWLAEGKGEVKINDTLYSSCYYTYIIGSENVEVGPDVFIREWDSKQWKEPLIEVE